MSPSNSSSWNFTKEFNKIILKIKKNPAAHPSFFENRGSKTKDFFARPYPADITIDQHQPFDSLVSFASLVRLRCVLLYHLH